MDEEETSMKFYRNAIILVAVVALLAGAYFLLNNLLPEEEGPTHNTPDSTKIVDFDSLETKKLIVKYPEEELVLVKIDDENWQLTSDKDLKLDNSRVRSIAINLSSVFVEKTIEENANDISVYGLDEPVVVTAIQDDESKYTLLIGDKTPTEGAYYAKLESDNNIYTIDKYTANKILASKNDLKLTTLFDVAVEDITELSLERNGELAFDTVKDGNEWKMTHPLQTKADLAKVGKIIDAICGLTVKSYIDDNSDLASFGLDGPEYILSFTAKEMNHQILFGDELDGKEIYAKLGNRQDVFKLDVETVNFLDTPVKEVVDCFVALPNINDVSKVVAEIDGYKDISEIEADEDSDVEKFTFNGKDATVENEKGDSLFKKYYQGLLQSGIMDDLDITGQPEGNAEIVITYYKENGEEIKIEFISRDEFYYYIVKNGKYTGLVVNKKTFDEDDGLRRTRKNLAEAVKEQNNS